MHACSNDLGNTSRIYLYAIILSILTFFWLLLPFYDFLKSYFDLTIPVWIETPSIIGLYGFYITLFDRVLWKYEPIKWFGLPTIPNVNGAWNANIKSSQNNTQKEGIATISQSYSKLSMVLKTDESTSETTMASFKLSNPINKTLTYTYLCKPLPTSPTTMNIHEGTAVLEILKEDKEMHGYYYSGRGRQNYGEISLTKRTA